MNLPRPTVSAVCHGLRVQRRGAAAYVSKGQVISPPCDRKTSARRVNLLFVFTDYSKGFGGKYGVEKEKVDKVALGYDYKGQTDKHQSQKGEFVS